MTPDRKLAAILAADVVGFSAMMQADEAGTLALLKQRRKEVFDPLVAKHRGRVIKLMGDGVLIEFASAVAAVQCAIELQPAMAAANAANDPNGNNDKNILLRIGVNLRHRLGFVVMIVRESPGTTKIGQNSVAMTGLR